MKGHQAKGFAITVLSIVAIWKLKSQDLVGFVSF